MWGWFGGGGVGNIFLAFYAISNISRKNNSGNKKQNMFLFLNLLAGDLGRPSCLVFSPLHKFSNITTEYNN